MLWFVRVRGRARCACVCVCVFCVVMCVWVGVPVSAGVVQHTCTSPNISSNTDMHDTRDRELFCGWFSQGAGP